MSRVNSLILLLLLLSSLYLVKIAYESRSLFVALDRAQTEERTLEVDYEKLQVDKRAQATPLRVERVAHDRLGMRTARPSVTQYVEYTAAIGSAQPDVSRDGLPLRPGEEAPAVEPAVSTPAPMPIPAPVQPARTVAPAPSTSHSASQSLKAPAHPSPARAP